MKLHKRGKQILTAPGPNDVDDGSGVIHVRRASSASVPCAYLSSHW